MKHRPSEHATYKANDRIRENTGNAKYWRKYKGKYRQYKIQDTKYRIKMQKKIIHNTRNTKYRRKIKRKI